MKKWEYKVEEQVNPDTTRGRLKVLGEEGWELVHIGVYLGNNILYMKRPLKEE